jgi:hypothetical protein
MANPTTNYGFVLPTSTDLVTDLPADFDVALQGVDTRLKALQPGTTLGDIAYSSATANTNTRLGIGSTGNVLTVAGGVPTWAAPAGGGKVLQVVQSAIMASSNSSSSSTFVDTGLSATITPSSATSKILILLSHSYQKDNTSSLPALAIKIFRNATNIFFNGAAGYGYSAGSSIYQIGQFATHYLDSPGLTSAITYKTQFANDNGSGTITLSNRMDSIILMEIGA